MLAALAFPQLLEQLRRPPQWPPACATFQAHVLDSAHTCPKKYCWLCDWKLGSSAAALVALFRLLAGPGLRPRCERRAVIHRPSGQAPAASRPTHIAQLDNLHNHSATGQQHRGSERETMLASSALLRAQPVAGRSFRRPAARRATLVTRSSLLTDLAVQVRLQPLLQRCPLGT